MMFTFAPRTPLLAMMHAVGKAFPRGNRAPAIEPVSERTIRERLESDPTMTGIQIGRSERVESGFYISNAMELVRR